MIILYFGKEQLGGYINTLRTVQGGYVAEIQDSYLEYVDWTSFDYFRKLTDDEINIGIPHSTRSANEYWTRDDDPTVVSTTWKMTKIVNGVKQKDPDGYAWSKVKENWTSQQEAAIVSYDKKWLEGKIVIIAKAAYSKLNLERGIVESKTWDMQLGQAKEYKATGSAGHLISSLASARGETVSALVDKIIAKNKVYEEKIAKILSIQQRLVKELDDCITVRDVRVFAEKYTDLYFYNDGTIQKHTIHDQFKNIS